MLQAQKDSSYPKELAIDVEDKKQIQKDDQGRRQHGSVREAELAVQQWPVDSSLP